MEGFPGAAGAGAGGAAAAAEGPFLLKGLDEGRSEAIVLIHDGAYHNKVICVIQKPLNGVSRR